MTENYMSLDEHFSIVIGNIAKINRLKIDQFTIYQILLIKSMTFSLNLQIYTTNLIYLELYEKIAFNFVITAFLR